MVNHTFNQQHQKSRIYCQEATYSIVVNSRREKFFGKNTFIIIMWMLGLRSLSPENLFPKCL